MEQNGTELIELYDRTKSNITSLKAVGTQQTLFYSIVNV